MNCYKSLNVKLTALTLWAPIKLKASDVLRSELISLSLLAMITSYTRYISLRGVCCLCSFFHNHFCFSK